MITAEMLYQASQIEPADLGADIIAPDDDAATQRATALAWIADNVLPGADAEVSVPFLQTTGQDAVAAFINTAFPDVLQATRDGWIDKGEQLYDLAVKSYGRSEINKCLDTNATNYDKDSDQDRIQGNQRLEKLLDWARVLLATQGQGEGENTALLARSGSGNISVRWA